MEVAEAQPHVGSVGLIGRPSTGKSSLINRICGHKVSIVSPVPQTTRSRVRGILTREGGQLIFLDTPGLHLSERKMNRVLRDVALSVAAEVDVLLLVFDAGRPFGGEDQAVLQAARAFPGPRLAVRNKVDLDLSGTTAGTMTKAIGAAGIDKPHSVSALTGAGVDTLVDRLLELSPPGELHYPADVYTDQSPDFRVAELVREQVFARTHAEVPHALFVEVLDLEPRPRGLWARATIWVERPSQVGIVVGRKGAGIAEIRRGAQAQLRAIFGRNVELDLRVKVRKKWRHDAAVLRQLRAQG